MILVWPRLYQKMSVPVRCRYHVIVTFQQPKANWKLFEIYSECQFIENKLVNIPLIPGLVLYTNILKFTEEQLICFQMRRCFVKNTLMVFDLSHKKLVYDDTVDSMQLDNSNAELHYKLIHRARALDNDSEHQTEQWYKLPQSCWIY